MNLRLCAVLIPFAGALLTSGCSTTAAPGSNPQPTRAAAPVAGAPAARATYTAAPPVGDVAQYEKIQAVIETERGNVYLEFYPKIAPKHVASFVKLSQDGFFDGLTFHRVEPGFVVQGGDPQGTGQGGPGFTLPAEFSAQKHERGTLAMARTQDPNSAGSQFYICLNPLPMLDNQYTVFGRVTKGMENVDKIQKGDHMLKVRIEPKGAAADSSAAPAGAAPASGGPSSAPSSRP